MGLKLLVGFAFIELWEVRFGETPKPARETRALPGHVNFCAFLDKLFRFLFHASSQCFIVRQFLFGCVLSDIFCDLDAAEMRAAHRTEMS
jgi:hypothetical protein